MESLTKTELITLGSKKGLTLKPKMLKKDMIEAIKAATPTATASRKGCKGEF